MAAKKPDAAKWADATEKILNNLDLKAEYEKLGVEVTGQQPNQNGWLACRAKGREDRKPSAAINVGDGPARGRYVDKAPTSLGQHSLNFFDFAAAHGPYADWIEAKKHFARQAGVKLPRGAESRPEDKLRFLPMHAGTINSLRRWADTKDGVIHEAATFCGARVAVYPADVSRELAHTVIAFPAYGTGLLESDPGAWVVMHAGGGKLPVYQGKDRPPELRDKHAIGSGSLLLGGKWLDLLADAEVVWKVEGLTDLLALTAGIPEPLRGKHAVLTNYTGAVDWKEEWAPLLAGKDVRIVHDADHAGQSGAQLWSSQLVRHGTCKSVRCVELPYEVTETHGKDLRDWLLEGHSFDDLIKLSESFERLSETKDALALTPEEAILDAIGLKILGEGAQRGNHVHPPIIGWSVYHSKKVRIVNIERWSRANAIQALGQPAKEAISAGNDEGSGRWPIAVIRDAISEVVGYRQLSATPPLGIGCWKLPDPDDRIVLVNTNHAATWNGRLDRIDIPVVGSTMLDFPGGDPWYDFDRLKDAIEKSADHNWCIDRFTESIVYFGQWNWRHSRTEQLIVSLICCTWLQSIWEWRPQVSIAGDAETGKSTLFLSLEEIFGPLGICTEKPTEAGIRQYTEHKSIALLIDEFEHDRHRQKILELFRASGKGGRVLRGTADQRGASYGLRHIPWMAAVETGLRRQADRSRHIVLDLDPPKRHGLAEKLPARKLAEMGMNLLAVALRHQEAARRIAIILGEESYPGVRDRVVENYSVPAAMMATVLGLDDSSAVQLLRGILDERDFSIESSTDKEELIRTIVTSEIRLAGGRTASVDKLLAGYDTDLVEGREALARDGIRIVNPRQRPGKWVYFCHEVVRRRLLKGTDWESLSVDQLLLRIPGAARSKQRLAGNVGGGKPMPGVIVPAAIVLGDDEEADEDEDSGENEWK